MSLENYSHALFFIVKMYLQIYRYKNLIGIIGELDAIYF